MVYFPEEDGGSRISAEACMSASMWVPLSRVVNPEPIIAAATFVFDDPATGESRVVSLAERVGDHLVVARYLFNDWEDKIGAFAYALPDFEYIHFDDRIGLRNEAQLAAWEKLAQASSGILNLGCGKGKTVMALKKIAHEAGPAVVVCPSGIIEQWAERAMEHLGMSADRIGIVRQSKQQWDRDLVLCSVDTLAGIADNLPMEVRSRFKVAIYDECHHMAARTFMRTANLFFGKRLGLTATPRRRDGLETVYYAHLGDIFYSDIIGDVTADVVFVQAATEVDLKIRAVRDRRGELSVGRLRNHLGECYTRNTYILSHVIRALSRNRKILVLSHSKDHSVELFRRAELSGALESYKVGLATSKDKVPKRLETIRTSDVTFATMGIAAEALDAPTLDTLFIVTPFSSWTEFQQAKGRVERANPGKQKPLVVIFDDVFVGPAHAMLANLKREMRANDVTHSTAKNGA